MNVAERLKMNLDFANPNPLNAFNWKNLKKKINKKITEKFSLKSVLSSKFYFRLLWRSSLKFKIMSFVFLFGLFFSI